MATSLDEEMNEVEEGTKKDENMNNEEYAKGTGVRKKEYLDNGGIINEKKKRFFQQYLYQQDYHEALRSLLWEPYDCRNNRDEEDEDMDEEENWCLLASKVPERKSSSSEGSTSSSEEGACAVNKRISWPVVRRVGASSKCGRPQSAWTPDDLDREQQLNGMVTGPGFKDGRRGAFSRHQSGLQPEYVQSVSDRGTVRLCTDMSSSGCGTLEPPDASDSTRLVESSASDGVSKPSSSGNVSVVNCYRAVPAAVVSSVPTIKCLNTQDNVSNVNVVQTYVRPIRNGPSSSKTQQKRPTSAIVPKTNRTSADPVLTHHSRSVSNPVLGQQSNRPSPSHFGSQQNLPIRLETHFGESTEHSQTFVTQNRPPQEVNVIHTPPSEPPKPRTFISTEAQTDDIGVSLNVPLRNITNREQRRRERRERRHQRRINQSVVEEWQTNVDVQGENRGLPDILHSHLPPPYIAGVPMQPPPLPSIHVPPPMPVAPPVLPHLLDPSLVSPPIPPGIGLPFAFSGSRRSRLSPRSSGYAHEEETPKACCGMVVTQAVSIRWFIVMIAFVGFCCVTVGTVLGAMKASGREHLTVSLLMIGVGIVLVTVSVVAWRLTSQDAPSCRSMLGLSSGEDAATEPNRRFVPRMPPSYGRPHHPYAAMMYPEFQYRPPPPSYQASMQEYRLRLLLLERPGNQVGGTQGAASPPPVYRSQSASTIGLRPPGLFRSVPQSEYSHPPSYRSRTSSARPSLDPSGGSVVHSRDPSLISHVSDGNGPVAHAVVNVISVLGNTVELHQADTDLQLDSLKLCVDNEVPIPPLRMLLGNKGKNSPHGCQHDGTKSGKQSPKQGCQPDDSKADNMNLVTIVTVSDTTPNPPNREHSLDNDVLAHL